MFTSSLLLACAASFGLTSAASVSGTAPGFASGTTGGGAGSTVTPNTISELKSYLTSNQPLTIFLTKTFDFVGSEGSTTETGCAPWGTAAACQLAINANNWCKTEHSNAPNIQVTYDKAGVTPINVASDKSIVGLGSSGVIKGKGLRFAGVKNVILQNVHITNLNPKYVWGGDAITLDGSSNIWIDHVKTSLIGRQHIVAGYNTNTAITISNTEIDGTTSYSATCDGHHYWALYFTGKNDKITFMKNYIHNTSGRSPKLGMGTLLHAVNNYWSENPGHAFEGEGSYALVEGSTFKDVPTPESSDSTFSLYGPRVSQSACQAALGRNCAADKFINSGSLGGDATSVLDQFKGMRNIAGADANADSVPNTAGIGKLGKRSIDWRDTCSSIAEAHQMKIAKLTKRNQNTWGFGGRWYIYTSKIVCLSTGSPPMPASIANEVCGAPVKDTKKPPNMSKFAPCALNACCTKWEQCGNTAEACAARSFGENVQITGSNFEHVFADAYCDRGQTAELCDYCSYCPDFEGSC